MDLRARGRTRRRKLVNRAAEATGTVAALLAVAVLAIVLVSVARRGGTAISWSFLTHGPATLFGQTGGGIAPAIVGSAELVLLALGTTRWEMVRGVILPATRSGVVAAVILGLGRALGEAIAVTQVIGGAAAIHWSLFKPGDTIASRLANEYQGATLNIQIASLFYLAAILLVIGVLVNLVAQAIVSRFEFQRTGGT